MKRTARGRMTRRACLGSPPEVHDARAKELYENALVSLRKAERSNDCYSRPIHAMNAYGIARAAREHLNAAGRFDDNNHGIEKAAARLVGTCICGIQGAKMAGLRGRR